MEAKTSQAPARPHTPVEFGKPDGGLRRRMYTIIFEADTEAGRRFDIVLVVIILLSIAVVMADSVPSIGQRHGTTMSLIEWGFTLLFSAEYIARLSCVRHPLRYATSFFGIIDLLSVLPTYFALLVPEASVFLDIRILRLLRVGGLVVVDNTLWSGRVADPKVNDEDTVALRHYNEHLHRDRRVDLSLLPAQVGPPRKGFLHELRPVKRYLDLRRLVEGTDQLAVVDRHAHP